MSAIPLKIIQKLWNACIGTTATKYAGHYAMGMDVGALELYHYGTLILSIYNGVPKNGKGWSASDRDAINSVLVLHGLSDKYKATLKGGYLHLVEL